METMKSPHWTKLDELVARGQLDEAKQLQQAYEAQWFERAKAGHVMNLTELIGGAETMHIAEIEQPSLYQRIEAVDLASVPVMSRERHIPRKQQSALARQLFKKLGLKGISVTAPNYSMAQVVEVRVPAEPHPGWAGFEQWEYSCYGDMPEDVPAKAAMLRHRKAAEKIGRILAVAFPQHDDRSDSQSDYFDRCWSVD